MLEGTLDDFTLADVLRLVASARRTGRLEVARTGGSGRLWFRDGAVAGAAPGYDRRRPADTPEAAIEDLTFDLMRWDLGAFTWAPEAGAGAEGAEVSVEVDDLLREVSRRLEELGRIHTLVPSEEAVLAWAPQPPEGAVQINITPSEWRVLVLVDGHRAVREIAAAAGLDDLDAMKVLFGLAAAGLVRTTGERSLAPAPLARAEEVTDMTDVAAMSVMSDALAEETSLPAALVESAPEAAAEPEPDEPEPEEPAAALADDDPFLTDFVMAPPTPAEVFGDSIPEFPEGDDSPSVDRSTAARELAGLFDVAEPGTGWPGAGAMVPAAPAPPTRPHRVEDDDQVTRGLISRLIEGVKGL